MRICLVAYADYDSDCRVRREAEALGARGDEVDVVCLREGAGGGSDDRIEGLRIRPVRMRRYRGAGKVRFALSYLRFFLLALLRVSRLHVSRRYDLVQVHNIPDFLVFTAIVPRLTGARVVLDLRDPTAEGFMIKYGLPADHPITRILLFQEVWSARFAHAVICVTEEHRRLFAAHGIPESKMAVVMGLPDERVFCRTASARRVSERFEIVFHGTLAERLGVDVAIRAVDRVRKEAPEVLFRVFGGGEHLAALRALVSELGLEEHVQMSGRFHPLQEIPRLVGAAHAGIVPNRKNLVTDLMLPVKLLEYVSLGIPVISPRLDTIMHYFDEESLGYFDPGDPDDLARAILELFHKPEKGAHMAARADAFLEAHNWADEKERYCRLIDRVAGNGHGPSA